MSDITITIHGGNNQILPNATEAIQNFYVGEYCGETSLEEGDGRSGLMPETIRFRAYINKEEDLERYLAQIVECRTVTELAQVILVMQENELKITPEEMVKERFIRLFLPITPRITKGKSVSNIRARINDAWSSRLRHRSEDILHMPEDIYCVRQLIYISQGNSYIPRFPRETKSDNLTEKITI